MGGVPHPLLEALAARATLLQDQLDIQLCGGGGVGGGGGAAAKRRDGSGRSGGQASWQVGQSLWSQPAPLITRPLPVAALAPPQAVVSLTWAYSTLAFDHPPLFDALAAATLRLLGPAPDPPSHLTGASTDTGGRLDSSSCGVADGGSSDEAGKQRGDFGAQAVSVVAFGLASANRCSSTPVQRMAIAALAARAAEVLPEFTTQGLANLAWALAVAACYPPTVSPAPPRPLRCPGSCPGLVACQSAA